MQPWAVQLLTGLVYLLVGVPLGMLCRFADWSIRQPSERRYLKVWWRDRLGSSVKSLALAVAVTGFMVEGSLLKYIPVAGSLAGIVLAAPVGLAITYGSHYLFAWGKRKAEEKTGVTPVEGD